MLAVLEHIDPEKVEMLFKEFRRILKTKGQIILTTPTPKAKAILEFLAFKLKLIATPEISDHKKYYDYIDLKLSIYINFELIEYTKILFEELIQIC